MSILPSACPAHQLADSLYQQFQQEPVSRHRIHRMLDKVINLREKRKYKEALELALYTKQSAQDLQYENGEKYADLNIGILNFWLGNYKESLDLSLMVLAYFEKVGDQRGVAESYHVLAKIYAVQDDFDKAIGYQEQALAIFEEYDDTLKIATSLNNIGVFHYESEQYAAALNYYTRVKQINQEAYDLHGLAITLTNFGEVYNRQKLPNRAIDYFEQALTVAQQTDDVLILAHANNEKGYAYILNQSYDSAAVCLERGRRYALKAGLNRQLLLNYQFATTLYQQRKDFERALFWQNHYIALKDSIYNDTKSQQMLNLAIAYDTEKKNQEISSLKVKNALQEERHQYNRFMLIVFIVAFLVALSLGIFWMRISKERKLSNIRLLKQRQAIQQKNEQIEQHTAKLSELNQIKTQLFSIISHDIRSPLSQLQGVLELLNNAQLTEEESRAVFKTINENVGYVNGLTENLLHWAKCQMGGIQAKPSEFDLGEVAEEARLLLNLQAEKKKITLTNNLREQAIIRADRDMVSLVIRNLLSNAIKFTRYQGSVCVNVRHHEDHHVICIKDTGVGIAPDRVNKLFTYATESTAGTANEKGTGIGLQVCYEFVTANNGNIWVESEEGVGSTFCFSFPKHHMNSSLTPKVS